VERETALVLDVLGLEDARQDLANFLLQEQAVPQQLRHGGVGVDDLDLFADAALAQQFIQHQRRLHRRDAALVRNVRRLGERYADEDPAFLDRAQLVVKLERGVVLVEVVATLDEALDAFGGGDAASGNHQVIVAVIITRFGAQAAGLEIERGHLVNDEVHFRAQE